MGGAVAGGRHLELNKLSHWSTYFSLDQSETIFLDQWESLYLLALRLGAGDEGGDVAILDQPDHPEEDVAVLGITGEYIAKKSNLWPPS